MVDFFKSEPLVDLSASKLPNITIFFLLNYFFLFKFRITRLKIYNPIRINGSFKLKSFLSDVSQKLSRLDVKLSVL